MIAGLEKFNILMSLILRHLSLLFLRVNLFKHLLFDINCYLGKRAALVEVEPPAYLNTRAVASGTLTEK